MFKFFSASFFALLLITLGCNAQTGQLLDPLSFQKKLKETPDAQLIDVRSPEEFQGGYIQGARNINYNSPDFEKQALALKKDAPVFVYCLSGGRSRAAASVLRQQGFTTVYELEKGTMGWSKAGLPLEQPAGAPAQPKSITYDEYLKAVKDSVPVLVDFYAPWCGPCKKMEPDLLSLEKEYAGKFRLWRINVDDNKELVSKLHLDAIPVLMVYKNGQQSLRMEGLTGKQSMVNALFGK